MARKIDNTPEPIKVQVGTRILTWTLGARTELGHSTAATAARIAATDTSGCDTIDTCEASTSVIVAPARSAILRCGRDDPVLGADHRPTRERLPGRGAGRGGVGREGERALARRDQPPVGLREILCEGPSPFRSSRWGDPRPFGTSRRRSR